VTWTARYVIYGHGWLEVCHGHRPDQSKHPQQVSHAVITAAMTVHTELSPGLLESTYTACVRYELKQAGFDALAQVALPVAYRGVKVELGYRMDLRVEDLVVVEVKSVDGISPVHQAQILSYLELSGKSIGLLINFNVVHLKDGIGW
jgi:GxxExxY protein